MPGQASRMLFFLQNMPWFEAVAQLDFHAREINFAKLRAATFPLLQIAIAAYARVKNPRGGPSIEKMSHMMRKYNLSLQNAKRPLFEKSGAKTFC
jgi:hypothetical protein